MKVREIMTSQVMTVGPDTPVPALASLFASRGISGVPVVDATGQLVGLGEGAADLRPFDPRAVARAIAGLPPQ